MNEQLFDELGAKLDVKIAAGSDIGMRISRQISQLGHLTGLNRLPFEPLACSPKKKRKKKQQSGKEPRRGIGLAPGSDTANKP